MHARYDEENGGHFGLNLDAYVHFTSPIRRYPDLMAHRQLKAHIHGREWVHTTEETANSTIAASKGCAKRMVGNWSPTPTVDCGGRLDEFRKAWATSWAAAAWTSTTFSAEMFGACTCGNGGKRRLVVDEHGLEVSVAEPDHSGEHPTILRLDITMEQAAEGGEFTFSYKRFKRQGTPMET